MLIRLVCPWAYLTEEINAPRWIRTADGVKVIDEVVG